jgi:hypothetical protein
MIIKEGHIMIKINLEGLKELTFNEVSTLRIALDERRERLSEGLKNISEDDSMYRVYVEGLVDVNNILDKLFPVKTD